MEDSIHIPNTPSAAYGWAFPDNILYAIYRPDVDAGNPDSDQYDELRTFLLQEYGVPSAEHIDFTTALICDALEAGVPVQELQRAAKDAGVYELVTPLANEVMGRARNRAQYWLGQVPAFVPEARRALVAADYMAHDAYANSPPRKSGGPYYTHPQQVAAISLEAFSQVQQSYFVEQEYVDAILALCLLHDGAEEVKRSRHYHSGTGAPTFNALQARYVFQETGNPHADMISENLLFLTHYAKVPGAPSYWTYILQGMHKAGWRTTKISDLWHNLRINPKPADNIAAQERVKRKNALYGSALTMIQTYDAAAPPDGAPKQSAPMPKPIWEPAYHAAVCAVTVAQMPQLVNNLIIYMYGTAAA